MRKTLLIVFVTLAFVYSANLAAQETGNDLFQRGRQHYRAGELDAAIADFEAAKKLEPGIRAIWKELGDVYLDRQNYDEAIKNYNQAIQISIDLNREEPLVYAKRGEAYNYKGNYDAVIADYSHAIRLDGKNSLWWNNRGEAYRSKGDYDRAIEDFKKAIEINNRYVNALNNLGLAYYGKGNYDMAIENFNEVIKIERYHAQAWNNRAAAYMEKGDYDRAIADYTQLIDFKVNYDYAIVYSNRSRAYRSKREYQKALADCDKALEIDRNYAPALNNRAHTYLEMGDYQKALAAFKESLDKAQQSININDISVYAWFLAGQVYEKYPYLKGDIKNNSFWLDFSRLALDGIGRGIRNAEDIRQNFGAQGAGLMAQMIYLYYAGVDFETVLGSPENTFFFSESLRSRGFLEQVGAEAAIRLPEVSIEERNRFKQLRKIIEEQQAIINTYDRANLEGEANEKYALAIRQRKDAEEALAELDRKLGSIPKYTALRNPKPVTLNQAKDYCGEDRAVLEYVLWDSAAYKPIKGYESWNLQGAAPAVNSYCLVITKNGLTAVPLEPGFDYHYWINELRELVLIYPYGYKNEYEKACNNLYNQLIKPVLPFLQNIKYITIVPDGELAVIPYDVLRTNNYSKSFGDSYVISLSPSLSVSILARKDGNISYSPILFFANDIYENRKYSDGQDWLDLDGVREEIDRLKKVAIDQKKEFFAYFREDATKEKIQQLSASNNLKRHPIIHFACHGFFDPDNPVNSGLVLYQISGEPVNNNSYLTIPEIAALELNAKIVILSACETGLGKAEIGEGMVGLVRAFMVAGAENVGVSLWKIDDKATYSFMENLYMKVLGERKFFRESYKEVKEMFRKGIFGATYEGPRYWAAFTMYE